MKIHWWAEDLMEEHLEPELRGLAVHDLHEAHVAVAGHVGRAEDGGHLVLPRGHLNSGSITKKNIWNPLV